MTYLIFLFKTRDPRS